MNSFTFSPHFKTIGHIKSYSQDIIKNEPMLFSCDGFTAMDKGGPITQEFLAELLRFDNSYNSHWIIDSRVHMLMPGWYPCIPGWHVDDVARTREDGQPQHNNPDYLAEHVSLIIDCGTGSLTEFLNDTVVLPEISLGKKVYQEWNDVINQLDINTTQVKSGDLVYFDCQDFHRGMPATGSGWRFFIRATRNTKRKILNEVRRQVQVYLPVLEEGW